MSVTEMPKRKLEDELEEDWSDTGTKFRTNVKKNSLDSDEEDDGEERAYNILAEDDIEGEEIFRFNRNGILFQGAV